VLEHPEVALGKVVVARAPLVEGAGAAIQHRPGSLGRLYDGDDQGAGRHPEKAVGRPDLQGRCTKQAICILSQVTNVEDAGTLARSPGDLPSFLAEAQLAMASRRSLWPGQA
jgi:hypothetical protein